MAKVGSEYYRFGVFPAIGTSGIEELYLKDNLNVNETWVDVKTVPYQTLSIPVTLNYSIKEKGTSRTVLNNNFSNVTHVRLDISAIAPIGPVGSGEFYYAAGVGLIDQTITINDLTPFGIPPSVTTQKLVSYSIK
jgi:hypothetical protein